MLLIALFTRMIITQGPRNIFRSSLMALWKQKMCQRSWDFSRSLRLKKSKFVFLGDVWRRILCRKIHQRDLHCRHLINNLFVDDTFTAAFTSSQRTSLNYTRNLSLNRLKWVTNIEWSKNKIYGAERWWKVILFLSCCQFKLLENNRWAMTLF